MYIALDDISDNGPLGQSALVRVYTLTRLELSPYDEIVRSPTYACWLPQGTKTKFLVYSDRSILVWICFGLYASISMQKLPGLDLTPYVLLLPCTDKITDTRFRTLQIVRLWLYVSRKTLRCQMTGYADDLLVRG